MARPSIPGFLRDLDRDAGAVRVLVSACLALLASGLAPRVMSPGLPSVQSAVRARPETEILLLIAVVISAGMLLVGGVLGDADGRRRIMRWALLGLVVTDTLYRAHPDWVLRRVLQFGDWDAVHRCRKFFGDEAIRRAAGHRSMDARTRRFWEVVLDPAGGPS
jgi:hypothetical protein